MFDFNDTIIINKNEKCVHDVFEEQVISSSEVIAVKACDRTLTYKELNEEANRIAHSLIGRGVKPNDIVAFVLPRRSYLLSVMMGILKTGAAYLPIDPDCPKERISYMLDDSKAKFCITENVYFELVKNEQTDNPNVDFPSETPCYCIYTSGSTGKPKGTVLTNKSTVNFCNNIACNTVVNHLCNSKYISIVSVTTVGFDIFVTESLLPLTNGLTIVLANEEQAKIQSSLNNLLLEVSVDVLQTTPTKMKSLITDITQTEYLKNLKAIILGGEALDNVLVEKLDKLTNADIYNIYGPTETTVWVTNAIIERKTDSMKSDEFDITIGKPIANTQIYILDKYGSPTPIGVTGELCIAGDCVGAGYLNRPELTAEKFVDNPFGEGKMYKTGDLAYWREDGNIVYVGRNDFQVKIRGLRIELGEIENAICQNENVSQAVVIVRKDETGRQLICAFYTEKSPADLKDIKRNISDKLPKYMMPHIFTKLDEMPLTSSGKINRKALPEVDLHNIGEATEYVEPVTELQRYLCEAAADILETRVGITDDFFDFGGDSLKAIEFVSKAHSDGVYFSLQNVYDCPTIKELCDFIDNGNTQNVSFDDYDFTEINNILSKNTCDNIAMPMETNVGDILLAGATGYLGIHILADYLANDSGTAFCLVRGENDEAAQNRMNELLEFYFGEKYTGNERIKVIRADITKADFGLSEEKYNSLKGVGTVINSAASVKHYGSYKYFYEANVKTVENLIEFCKLSGARLIHTSTLSVSGNSFGDNFDGYVSETEKNFYESSLYIGQPLDNVYARSKFEAEKAVLEAMTTGLQANIMRMGNLTNRLSDGVFQKNYESNASAKRLKAVLELGILPDYLDDMYVEFTPIDEAAHAVMTIARNFSTENTVFHINSIKVVYFDELVEIFGKLGYPMRIVNGTEFTEHLRKSREQTETTHIFDTFINDMDENDRLTYDSKIRIKTDFTTSVLKNLGFEWSDIGYEYLKKYVDYFKSIGYLKGVLK